MLRKHSADRLDTPPQTTGLTPIGVSPNEIYDQPCGRSSSAAKKTDAAFKIPFARFSSATSRRKSRTCADSVGAPWPARAAWASARRIHCRNVSGEVTPSSGATRWTAFHSDSAGGRSATIRTARDFNSTGYRLDVFPGITPTFPRFRVSGHTGAIQPAPEAWEQAVARPGSIVNTPSSETE